MKTSHESSGKGTRRMDGQTSPEAIEESLERTRAELNDTLSALEHRLSPGQLVDQALDYLRGGPREYAQNLMGEMKRNPVPTTLVGIGLAWLMVSGRRGGAGAYEPQLTSEGIAEGMGSMSEAAHGMSERMSEKSAELKARVGRRVSEMRESMGRVSGSVRSRSRSMASGVQERGEGMTEQIRLGSERARGNFSHLLDEQPMVLGALGLALGAALSAGMPSGRRMRDLTETARDELKRRVRSDAEGAQVAESREPPHAAETSPQEMHPGSPSTPIH